MKKLLFKLFLVFLSTQWSYAAGLIFISSCGNSHQEETSKLEPDQEKEGTLILFLTRTENTEALAKIIHDQVGGTLVELELENPYPEDYQSIVEQVDLENETGFLPALKTRVDSMENYATVFVGFPTWDMQLPPPMKSFLNHYNLSGKTIIPFNTNGGYGVGSGFETVKELCPNSTVLEGYSTTGGSERDGILFVMEGEKREQTEAEVKEWLQKIIN
jgi:flavodoxin